MKLETLDGSFSAVSKPRTPRRVGGRRRGRPLRAHLANVCGSPRRGGCGQLRGGAKFIHSFDSDVVRSLSEEERKPRRLRVMKSLGQTKDY